MPNFIHGVTDQAVNKDKEINAVKEITQYNIRSHALIAK